MDVRSEKLWLIDQIVKITDEELIRALKNMLEYASSKKPEAAGKPDFWDELSDAQKQRIQESIRQLDNGEGIPHEAVMAEFRVKYSGSKGACR
jgi:hypothetical protein